jgi:hypothetical protein
LLDPLTNAVFGYLTTAIDGIPRPSGLTHWPLQHCRAAEVIKRIIDFVIGG